MNPSPPTTDVQPSAFVEVDLELLEFLERYVQSILKWDIAVHFGENPNGMDTASSIATRIGRIVPVVERELNDLVLLGLLRQSQLDSRRVYQLTDDASVRHSLTRFIAHHERVRRGMHSVP